MTGFYYGSVLLMNKLGIIIVIILCSTLSPLYGANDIFTIQSSLESANLSSFLHYMPEKEDSMNIAGIMAAESSCPSINSKYVNFGYTTTPYWFCLHVMNSGRAKDAILEFDYPVLDYVDLYLVHGGKVQQIYNTGDRRQFSTRPLASRTLAFPLDLQQGLNRVFFKVKTQSSLNFSIFLHSREHFVKNNTREMSLLFMFYGIMLFTGIYNFFIFFSTRDTAHLFFSFFSLSLMFYLMSLRGLGFMFLWPESTAWANRAIPTFAFMLIGSAGLFFDSMLKFHQYLSKRLRWGILLFIVLAAFMLGVQFLMPYIAAVQVVNYLLFGVIGYVLLTSLYSGIKDRNRNAWFILVGFLPLFMLAPLQLLASMGYLPTFFLTQWKIEISFLWLILATSLGLADTINVLNRRLNISRHSMEESNIQLQEKNKELNAAMEELEATNEEFEAQNEELLRAYWELEQNELRYRSIVEDQTEFITRWEPDGIITFANRAYCREFGLEPEHMVGKSFFEFIPEYFHAGVWEKIRSLTPENPVKVDEHRVIRGDGSTGWHQWIDRAFFDDHGNPTGYQSVGRDITEKKETEIALRRLATTVEQASEDIIITDTEGNIQYVNPAFEKITGYSRDEVMGKKPSIIKSGIHPGRFYENLWQTIKAGKTWYGRITNKSRNGELIHEESVIFPIIDDDGNILNFAAIKRDITEQINLEEQLLQAQKMEAIGTLVGGLAHDFNNVLGGIIGSVEILDILLNDQKLNNSEEVWSYINTIRDSSNRAVEMIKQLLSLSRRQEMEKKNFDLNESLEHVLNICKNSFPKSVLLDFHFTEEPCFVYADQTRIEQVVLNLCVNASQAMTIMEEGEEGGTLSVSVSKEERDSSEGSNSSYACIVISDTGIGMDEDIRTRMFEPFFTTKDKEIGTGLGLSMVYNIVQQHQGIIDVESEPGKGTTMKVFLPYLDEGDEEKTTTKKTTKLNRGTGVILVVDDEKPLRQVAAGILEKAGYTAITAEDGQQALQIFTDQQESIEMVLLDMSMPVMSGIDVFTAIRDINPDIKVLVTSGFGLDGKVQKILDMGASNFISKPFNAESLTQKVKQVLS